MRPGWCVVLGVLLVMARAGAQEERAIGSFAGVGTRAMAMGGAYVGVADDFTAVYWNPAGLAQIRQRELLATLTRNGFDSRTDLGGTPATAGVSNTRFGTLGFVFPLPVERGSLVLAGGYNRVNDFGWVLEKRGRVDSLAIEDRFRHEGEIAVSSLAAAIDVSPSVSLGAAVNLVTGRDDARNEFVSVDTEDYFFERRFVDREQFLDDYGRAWTATLGVMLRKPRDDPRFRLGLAVTTGATYQISYAYLAPPDTAFSLVEFDDGTLISTPGGQIDDSYTLSLPLSIGVGLSYRPLPYLLLAAGLQATEWSQTEYGDGDEARLRTSADFERQYEDVVRWHLGVEVQLPRTGVDLRAGAYADPLPFLGPRDPARGVDPVTNPLVRVRQDRRYWTAGAGFFLEETVRCDLTYTRGEYEQVEGEGNTALLEAATLQRLSLGLSYRF